MVKQKIVSALQQAIKDVVGEDITVQLERPADPSNGDYSTNIAMAIFAKLKAQSAKLKTKSDLVKTTAQSAKFRNPLELAQKIVQALNSQLSTLNFIDRVEAVAPGFINFYLSKDYLVDQLQNVLKKKEEFGSSTRLRQGSGRTPPEAMPTERGQRKIMVEFTDPNPFKEFHIGHLYSNAVGESLCRMLEAQGAKVWRVNYQGDIGLHIAKSLYAILQISNLKNQISNIEKKNPKERAEFLGKCYAAGSKAYEDSKESKEEINQINKKIYEGNDINIKELYEIGRRWSLEYYETIYKRLGTTFTRYYFESEAGPIGLRHVKDHIKDGVFKESEGAVIFEGEKYGLHNRVFINSLGLPTYEAKDMALPSTKYKDFPYDRSIIITANEQNGYFQVVLKALSLVNPDLAAKTKHIGHGMVRLPTGKMSSRTGDVITGEWLLDEAKKKIQEQYKAMDRIAAEKVAVGAVKYALLKSGIGRDIAFNFDESISLEGNSGPYLQYTYARTRSVLAKLKIQNSKLKATTQNVKLNAKPASQRGERYTLNAEEVALLRVLHRFPEVVAEAAEKFAPSLLCTYLFDLAQKFNLFYQKHSILESEQKEFRLALAAGVGEILKTGLYLLGIQAPERM